VREGVLLYCRAAVHWREGGIRAGALLPSVPVIHDLPEAETVRHEPERVGHVKVTPTMFECAAAGIRRLLIVGGRLWAQSKGLQRGSGICSISTSVRLDALRITHARAGPYVTST
jgi:hypothetical protein